MSTDKDLTPEEQAEFDAFLELVVAADIKWLTKLVKAVTKLTDEIDKSDLAEECGSEVFITKQFCDDIVKQAESAITALKEKEAE